jgi:transcription initiation factor TFIID TATA-box-binding protein
MVKDIKFKIENIVASAALGIELDLYTLGRKVPNIEYEPEQFPGAILKLKHPKASLLLFKNGKIICTGCRTEKEVRLSIRHALELLLKAQRKR